MGFDFYIINAVTDTLYRSCYGRLQIPQRNRIKTCHHGIVTIKRNITEPSFHGVRIREAKRIDNLHKIVPRFKHFQFGFVDVVLHRHQRIARIKAHSILGAVSVLTEKYRRCNLIGRNYCGNIKISTDKAYDNGQNKPFPMSQIVKKKTGGIEIII